MGELLLLAFLVSCVLVGSVIWQSRRPAPAAEAPAPGQVDVLALEAARQALQAQMESSAQPVTDSTN